MQALLWMRARLHAEKISRVESAGRVVFVLEKNEDLAVTRQRYEALRQCIELCFGVAAGPPQPIAAMWRRLHVGRGELIALGHAQSCVVLAQHAVDFLCEPALVPELKRKLNVCDAGTRAGPENVASSSRARLQVRRKLKEQRTKMAGAHRRK